MLAKMYQERIAEIWDLSRGTCRADRGLGGTGRGEFHGERGVGAGEKRWRDAGTTKSSRRGDRAGMGRSMLRPYMLVMLLATI